MITWVLFVFLAYADPYHKPIVIEGFTSLDVCEISGEQIASRVGPASYKCVKVEK